MSYTNRSSVTERAGFQNGSRWTGSNYQFLGRYNGANWVQRYTFYVKDTPATKLVVRSYFYPGGISGDLANYPVCMGITQDATDSRYLQATEDGGNSLGRLVNDTTGGFTVSGTIDLSANPLPVSSNPYYLFLYPAHYYGSGNAHYVYNGSPRDITEIYLDSVPYSLSISQGSNTSITVKRNGLTLSNGTDIWGGDTLNITFNTTKEGYYVSTHKVNNSDFTSGNNHTVAGNVSVTSAASVLSYILGTYPDKYSTITVKRTASPLKQASIGVLSNGAAIYYSDIIEVHATPNGGYEISQCSINDDTTYQNGTSYIVKSNVTASSIASLKKYKLNITTDSGSNVFVSRISSQQDGASVGALSANDTIYHFDVLSVMYTIEPGFSVLVNTVNGTKFESGADFTVDNNMNIIVTAELMGLIHIWNGSSYDKYLVFICNGSSWDQYIPKIYDNETWNLCS